MVEEQREQLGGSRQPPERDRAELIGAGLRMPWGDDLDDPRQGRLDPHDVAGLAAGDHGAQAELVGARGGHVAPAAFGLDPGLVQLRVGLDDLGLGDLQHPAPGLVGDHPRDCLVDHGHHRER